MKEFIMLVTPEEAVSLSEYSVANSGKSAMQIANHCKQAFKTMYSGADPAFNYLCMVQAIFEAGRIQGIREERNRRKHNKA